MERSATSAPSASRKSKPKGTASRSVSMLTPTQLARKRANDREAQRAIRTRTKQYIQQLEDQVRALRDGHAKTRTVQDLLHRNASLEAELDDLRAALCLSSDMNLMPETPTWAGNAPVVTDVVAQSCSPVPWPVFYLPPVDPTPPDPLCEATAPSEGSRGLFTKIH